MNQKELIIIIIITTIIIIIINTGDETKNQAKKYEVSHILIVSIFFLFGEYKTVAITLNLISQNNSSTININYFPLARALAHVPLASKKNQVIGTRKKTKKLKKKTSKE